MELKDNGRTGADVYPTSLLLRNAYEFVAIQQIIDVIGPRRRIRGKVLAGREFKYAWSARHLDNLNDDHRMLTNGVRAVGWRICNNANKFLKIVLKMVYNQNGRKQYWKRILGE